MTKTPQVPAMPGMTPLGFKPASPPYVFQAMAIRRAMEFYAKTGMRVNTAYTPKNMLATAAKITGKDYGTKWNAKTAATAVADLVEWLKANGAPT